MRKMFLAAVGLLLCFAAHSAQPNSKWCYMYGVDFSEVQVFGAMESEEDFAQAFENINLLFITEADKYDVSQTIGHSVKLVLEPMMNLLKECDYEDLKTYDDECPEIDIAECVESYDLEQEEGLGVVIIAKFLNKPEKYGEYAIVVFDIATRNVIKSVDVFGAAGGFGLRNFWAKSVYNVLTSVYIKLPK
ncbi:MAG: hypothetical protein J6U69_00635 [Alistipes sp.]|nr:hypothetical protein [Alistipes sp.]